MKNIIEILKNAPSSINLYSQAFGYVEFIKIQKKVCGDFYDFEIIVTPIHQRITIVLDKYGRLNIDGECVLFPSKDSLSWDSWQKELFPFSVGHCIVNGLEEVFMLCEYGEKIVDKNGVPTYLDYCDDLSLWRYATEEESSYFKGVYEKSKNKINNNKNISKLSIENRDKFLSELKNSLHENGIDTICNTPDFILADNILDHIYSIEKLNDNTMWWDGKR